MVKYERNIQIAEWVRKLDERRIIDSVYHWNKLWRKTGMSSPIVPLPYLRKRRRARGLGNSQPIVKKLDEGCDFVFSLF